jgi:hypothetical protein
MLLCCCSGKFTWRVRNFELFREMIRAQKIMSPPFPAGDCSLRISVYQSPVSGSEHLSLCLESKVGAQKGLPCWVATISALGTLLLPCISPHVVPSHDCQARPQVDHVMRKWQGWSCMAVLGHRCSASVGLLS